MATEKCMLCDHELSEYSASPAESIFKVKCDVCGLYLYSNRARAKIRVSKSADKVAAVLRERELKGHPPAFIVLERQDGVGNQMTLDEVLALYPRSASEMIDRVILNLAAKTEHPCDQIVLRATDYPLLFGRANRSKTDGDVMTMRLKALGYIDLISSTISDWHLDITPAGWKKIEELQRASIESKQVFVAMWFDPQTDRIFSDGIRPAIEKGTDYRALRMDLKEHNNKICDQIIAEIRRSKFMVADFTGSRGGVYFEAGFALGLGIPVIWTVCKEDLPQVHFDTRQYNHIDYENPAELQERLGSRIRATIV